MKEKNSEEADSGLAFFKNMYDKYRDAFLNHLKEYALEEEIKEHISKYYKLLFDYNCLGGKYNRGILVILIYEYVKNRDINSIEWEKAACLAWCIEILQASFLVADDIMDKGEKRRKKYCWYLLKDVETKNAVNDILLLYNSIYKLIEIYLRNESCYVDILSTFRDATLKTIIGQHLDTNIFSDKYTDLNKEIDVNNINVPEQEIININMVNFEVYKNIVIHKTAYYSFFLPIVCGMLLGGIAVDNLIYKKIEGISMLMGEYFQVHDDYLDVFADSKNTGKVGTDIQNNKLTWPLIKAFELCSESDKMKIVKNYGQNNLACVKVIESIYEQYKIKKHYEDYERAQKERILSAINELHHEGIEYVLKYLMEILFTGA
ncbi:geranylgeranyl pyrophosphate synthase, putative [Plasmodium knowlesi strain H]|uniref:Geranylgeranyl pyrophosphate synthase, putative n=3 Tax=Plasmodium knowlesi TaxID=5850 RepID=A0A5K1U2W5_PLAKH|nr:bifunctional farnesyl/geranylgeranyl diphosphate synthase, putative [Plasmodium knowlesi strain H]OTN65208.1 putative Farnesyl pyrophosphate synthase [Plasmodium knowlesi]CAA9988312.1 bifunctional farnesyl/geranylgeranyl diphosphate synthase, putative [Plasmodium knowlesi strain H]SBO20239.1 geranylgeranyl pyrophosphate synthase, putative [Plasmodium knowlesi strain H]SBO20259.1 geranylgeranyl pyrophosphate synthase, putative [Plasmodium knowlesi strain H]VVS77786.1 bifunctional farnesyl/ge|eukprot:XP_002259291.1 Farnesyl pyrophosphate synthase, putative [Plasmodium knowlesi strain H]